MVSRSKRLDAILQCAVEAYDRGEAGQARPLLHIRAGGGQDLVQHAGWPPFGPPVSREDLRDLEDFGWVRVTEQRNSWAFTPTMEGSKRVEELKRARLRPHLSDFDASWSAIRPVLKATVDAWEARGASQRGVELREIGGHLDDGHDHDDNVITLVRALELLQAGGWLGLEYEPEYQQGTAEPLTATPSARALQAMRGWPGELDTEALAERLLSSIDQTIEETPDEEERGRLRKLREFALDLGSNTTAEIVAKLAGGALG